MDYKNAGVDIEAGYESVELMKKFVKGTMRPEVLGGLGGFSGAFSLENIKKMEEPILLSGTDGCGTKVKLAFLMDKHDTIGIDAVAMCVNDVACAGGFFCGALNFVSGPSGYACGLQGHLARLVLQPIFLLADAVCAEAVGLDYVGSRRNIGLMNSLNRVGVAKVESLEIGCAREACLKHRSHRAVEHQYAVCAV